MKSTRLLYTTLAAIILVGGCSKTEGTKRDGTKPSAQPAERPTAVGTGGAGADLKSDSEFVHDAATMNMAEIELSRMALDKATSNDIKFFAQRMVDDHNAAVNELKSVASESVAWPAQPEEKQRKTSEDLGKKQGGEFDFGYVKAIVEGHQNLAAILESRLDVQSLAEWKTAAAGRAQ